MPNSIASFDGVSQCSVSYVIFTFSHKYATIFYFFLASCICQTWLFANTSEQSSPNEWNVIMQANKMQLIFTYLFQALMPLSAQNCTTNAIPRFTGCIVINLQLTKQLVPPPLTPPSHFPSAPVLASSAVIFSLLTNDSAACVVFCTLWLLTFHRNIHESVKHDLRLSAVRQLVTLYRAVFDENTENSYSVNGINPVTVTASDSLYYSNKNMPSNTAR